MTNLGLQYKCAFNFSDLRKAPSANKVNKKKSLERMLQIQAPLFFLRKFMLKKSLKVTNEAVFNYQKKWYIEKENSKPQSVKQKELKEKQYATI